MIDDNLKKDTLFPTSVEGFKGEDYFKILIEQYKIYVKMADNISERRSKMNSFFLSANSFLITALGLLVNFNVKTNLEILWLLVASIGGLTFAVAWFVLIQNYKHLNSSKYSVLLQIEQKLAIAPYTKEWELLNPVKIHKRYVKLTDIEKVIPIVFMILYSALILGIYLER